MRVARLAARVPPPTRGGCGYQVVREVPKMVPVSVEVVREIPVEVVRQEIRDVVKEVIKEVRCGRSLLSRQRVARSPSPRFDGVGAS